MNVAVVAAACEFPDARTLRELWATVLHGRRSFRRIPAERLIVDDYVRAATGPDSIYPIEAALLEGYRFDRERFRVPESAFERTDMAHWLALDVATRALSDLDPAGMAAERDTTAVIVANTLTGEFSRSHLMRYRWPYVERLLRDMRNDDQSPVIPESGIRALEAAYKAPFPAPDEDSLAGGLSNTIAGRIANHHGLRGGAHTVDGACASSLVAVVTAFERLAMGDIGCVVVGAVDLSLDPFELVGFARNGALARQSMRIFDEKSDGFWPGEGCGFLVLASEEVVARRRWPVLAWVRGAAMSTDGEGALTRPTVEGQTLAAQRAWARAGLSAAAADYFEAHGTGTPTGDPVELAGLAGLLGATVPDRPIPVGSIKGNIGHTKAAAGMAGLLKAIAICRERIIPPTTGCEIPHAILQGDTGRRVNVRSRAELVSHAEPIVVGVNSFGFGGVNCHVVIQGAEDAEPHRPTAMALPLRDLSLLPGELFQLQAVDDDSLAALLATMANRARTLSRAQMGDLAFALNPSADPACWRASLVAATPQELQTAADAAVESLRERTGKQRHIGARFCWSAPATASPRVALLFPGQGLPLQMTPGPWAARFPSLAGAASRASTLAARDLSDTAVVQPLLGEVAVAGLQLLAQFGIEPSVVFGHSFGELSALLASGRIDVAAFRAMADARGQVMSASAARGAMIALRAPRDRVIALTAAHGVDLACENGANRYVLAGETTRIDAVAAACSEARIAADILPTSRAFHSRLMQAASDAFSTHLATVNWLPGRGPMVSSVTGVMLDGAEHLPTLLARQVVAPVKFADALDAIGDVDLVIEVGASASLVGLVAERKGAHALSLELFADSPVSMLLAIGAFWTFGGELGRDTLYAGRMLRPCGIDDHPVFLANPCGLPVGDQATIALPDAVAEPPAMPDRSSLRGRSDVDSIDALRAVLAEVTGLGKGGLGGTLRLLGDLHLNSIRARHAIATTARRLGVAQIPFDLSKLAKATLDDVAAYLDGLRHSAPDDDDAVPAGLEPWLRLFDHRWVDAEVVPVEIAGWPWPVVLEDSLAPLPHACRSCLCPPPDVGGAGMFLLVLPSLGSDHALAALLECAMRVTSAADGAGLLVLQGAQLANGFLRSIAAEVPNRRWCVVEYEQLDPATLECAVVEFARRDHGFSELRLRGRSQQRRQLAATALQECPSSWAPPPDTTVVVTGGARGIGAATALALAQRFQCRLALVGRTPADDPEIVATVATLQATGSDVRYYRGDLSDDAQASTIVADIEAGSGPVCAVIHSAGINRPSGVAELTLDEIKATVASKVASLDNLLAHLSCRRLELVIGYSSIIGELGLAGESHYALANEWLNNLLSRVAGDLPNCRVIPICWSAWGEAGMAVRLEGVLDGLRRAGTRPIDSTEAIDALRRLLSHSSQVPVIVTGRYGRTIDPATELGPLQAHRYLERPRVFYPGVELVADAEVCSDGDRYLRDHAPFHVPVFPLVCALEAMVSAAQCVCERQDLPVVEELSIGEAVSCTLGQRFVLRTAALVRADGSVHLQVRSDTTGFDVVHFSARLTWAAPAFTPMAGAYDLGPGVPAAGVLYQGLCFHGPRFHRVATVVVVSATHCRFRTGPGSGSDWYGPLLPQRLLSGDLSIRDAVLHGLQMCVPHQVVLPVGAATIRLGRLATDVDYTIDARQTFSDGRRFVFDIQVCDAAGMVAEQWIGLELLRSVAASASEAPCVLPRELLQPLLVRLAVDELGAHDATAGVVFGQARDRRSGAALALALGRPVDPGRAPHGAVRVEGARVSTSHADDVTVALARTAGPVAVDLQFQPDYPIDDWRVMLGEPRSGFADHLARQGLASLEDAMLIVWTLSECLIKLGCADWQLATTSFQRVETSHMGPVWFFDQGSRRMAVVLLKLASADVPRPAMLAVAVEGVAAAGDARLVDATDAQQAADERVSTPA